MFGRFDICLILCLAEATKKFLLLLESHLAPSASLAYFTQVAFHFAFFHVFDFSHTFSLKKVVQPEIKPKTLTYSRQNPVKTSIKFTFV